MMRRNEEQIYLNSQHSLILEQVTGAVLHSLRLEQSLWRVFSITLSSYVDMPSLTNVTLHKGSAFRSARTVQTKSSSCSHPSFLDITSALQYYLPFSLSFTHFSLSAISYTCFRSPFSIHPNHSLFYSQATHKSHTHHEHHSSPVIRFQQRETAQQRETPSLHFAFSFFLSFYSTHVSTFFLPSSYLLFLSILVALPHTVLTCSILHPHCGSTSTALHRSALQCNASHSLISSNR